MRGNAAVLVSNRNYQREPLSYTVEHVEPRPGTNLSELLNDRHLDTPPGVVPSFQPGPNGPYRRVQRLPGHRVGAGLISARRLYRLLLGRLMTDNGQQGGGFGSYWTTRPVRYTPGGDGHLRPVPVKNDPTTTWVDSNQGSGFAAVPPDLADIAFRSADPHAGQGATAHGVSGAVTVTPAAVGEFDPSRLVPERTLNRVPLETYQPPSAKPLGPKSIRALHGRPLTPTNGFTGYLSEPPTMLTTLTAARALLSRDNFFPTSHAPRSARSGSASPVSPVPTRSASPASTPSPIESTRPPVWWST